jgi:hypothetical protein
MGMALFPNQAWAPYIPVCRTNLRDPNVGMMDTNADMFDRDAWARQ